MAVSHRSPRSFLPRPVLQRAGTALLIAAAVACGAETPPSGDSDDGAGGTAPGGGSGGSTAGTPATGGESGVAGSPTGGSTTGGAATGGSGGATTGGAATGGSGGTAMGGSATGGLSGTAGTTPTGGSAGNTTTGGTAGSAGANVTGGAAGSGGAPSGGSGGQGGTAGSSGGKGGTAGTGGAGAKFHVFLLLGQSNMAGYADAQAADKVEDARVRVLGFDECTQTGRHADQWDTAAPPLHECWNLAVGPGDWFAKTMLPKYPSTDTIGLVPCAISGERIETFLKVGGTKYTWILGRARAAQQAGGVIDGILFHQGESNTGDSSWPGKVNTLITDLRTDLGTGNIPFLAGELAPTGNSSSHNTQVARIPGMVTNSFVVSASGLAVDPADTQYRVHFSHDATVEFGKRYAAKMIEALQL